ncbi:HBL396Cp [Eremothecium sinecaudum]|uniref:HBL396Cp n=1 Tax=Eremothecium sinecaudum TaxID=45286 RepID=A0A109UVT8_9SACH|nr:HBL396Cp [Eremothecium sinecaudum]AMD18506.1 HBL396Cp [Eremothecium sinecaudum]
MKVLGHVISTILLTICTLLEPVLSDVRLTAPSSGKSFSPSGGMVTIEVTWDDDGNDPAIGNIQELTFTLMTGTNDNIQRVAALGKVEGEKIREEKYAATFPSTVGKSGFYFIQLYAKADGSATIHYTPRFLLQSMTGTLDASSTGTEPPPPPEVVHDNPGDISKSFSIPYTLQTGRTRFAPMQLQPKAKVTATHWNQRFPSSQVSYYSSINQGLSQLTTITPGWSYNIPSVWNLATPAPFPADNGAWYEAQSRLSLLPRKINAAHIRAAQMMATATASP